MKYEAIEQYNKCFTVKKMCKVFGINPSNYYRWKRNKKKKEDKTCEQIKVVCQIEKIFKESDKKGFILKQERNIAQVIKEKQMEDIMQIICNRNSK